MAEGQAADDWLPAPDQGPDDWVAHAPPAQNVSRETSVPDTGLTAVQRSIQAGIGKKAPAPAPARSLMDRINGAAAGLSLAPKDAAEAAAEEWGPTPLGMTPEQLEQYHRAVPGSDLYDKIADYTPFGALTLPNVAKGADIAGRAFESAVAAGAVGMGSIASSLGMDETSARALTRDLYAAGQVAPLPMEAVRSYRAAIPRAPVVGVPELQNIAKGKPSNAPPETPVSAASPTAFPQANAPASAPGVGQAIGLKFPNAPPRRAAVDHYFDNGNAVRLRFDDGTVRDFLTSDVLRDQTAAPEPMQEASAPSGNYPQLTQAEREAAPLDDWLESSPSRQPRAATTPTLGADQLRGLDQAHSLERTALDARSNLSSATRQDMLTEAARLRRTFGATGDVPPAQYRHPLAAEPAAPLGELAIPRVQRPQLYEQTPEDLAQSAQIDAAAAETHTEPSPAQVESGNYRKGQISVQGLPVSIETPKGAVRRGVTDEGEPWENTNDLAHYGYIRRTEGADGDHVDTYVGPHPTSQRAFVVDQVHPETGDFDEHKVVLGARTPEQARAIYDAGFSDESGPSRRGAMTEMSTAALKDWLKSGDTTKPLSPRLDPHLEAARADVDLARSPQPKAQSLFDAIRELGGVQTRDAAGNLVRGGDEIESLLKDYRNEPFKKRLVQPTGLSPDALRSALQERGWFGYEQRFGPEALETGSYPGDDIQDLYDLVDQEARGQKHYQPESDEARAIYDRRLLDEELGRAGVGSNDPADVAARKLADFRNSAAHDRHLDEQERSIDEEFAPAEREELDAHGYEPGADIGAEYEAPGGLEGRPDDTEPAVGVEGEAARGDQPAGGNREGPAESFTTERQDLGRGVTGEQTVIPGAERSARQLAQAREAAGHGRATTRVEQREPGGLFAPEDTQKTLFQAQRPTASPEDFRAEMDRRRAQRADLERALAQGVATDGRVVARSSARPGYSIMLSRGTEAAPYRVTSFDGADPTGHRDYNSIAEAAQEFLPRDMEIAGRTQFQVERAQTQPTFFSALARNIDDVKQARATPEQWSGMIDNLRNKGVKQEEIDWSGVKDWLRDQKGSVAKDALQNFLRENDVRVQEVEKGAGLGPEPTEPNDYESAWNWVQNESEWDERKRLGALGVLDRAYESPSREGAAAMRAVEIPERFAQAVEGWAGNSGGPTKYGEYTLPGDKNYRELLLTLPEKQSAATWTAHRDADGKWVATDGRGYTLTMSRDYATADAAIERAKELAVRPNGSPAAFRSGHFDEPNVLAHVRFDDRTGPDGEKILHMAEVQSDWHQSGRKRGYEATAEEKKRGADEREAARRNLLDTEATIVREISGGKHPYPAGILNDPDLSVTEARHLYGRAEEALRTDPRAVAANERYERANTDFGKMSSGVPNAPFKQSWHELALKRMLRYAAENGYDKLSWDTGKTEAARYDLSKQIDAIDHRKTRHGYDIYAIKDGQQVFAKHSLSEEALADTVGKDVAEKIVKGEGAASENGTKRLSGVDLKVGGEGMKGFYDRILPQFLNKYAKKWGAKVGLGTVEPERAYEVVPRGNSFYVVHSADRDPVGAPFATEAEANAWMRRMPEIGRPAPAHSIDITSAMRESVMQGQPLFQRTARAEEAPQQQGERVRLADDLIGRTLGDNVSPAEARVLNAVEAEAKRVIPSATVRPMRSLEMGQDFAKQAGSDPRGRVTGATYANGARRAIAWSLESPDAVGTLRHEAVHYLYGRGLIRPDEWSALSKAASDGDWLKKHDIDERYPNASAGIKLEEAVAEEFSQWRRAPSQSRLPPIINRAFERVAQFLNGVASKVRDLLGQDVTADDVFNRIASGEVGRRGGALPDRSEPRFQAARPEEPEDQVTDAMAEDARAKGPGAYARYASQKLAGAWKPGATKHVGELERRVILPQTLSSMDWRSAAYYGAVKMRDALASTARADWREPLAPYHDLKPDSQDKVLAAAELLRLNGQNIADDGRSVVLRNEGHPDAALSKPGQTVALNPAETKALFGLKGMFAQQWQDLKKATAARMGWDGEADADAIRRYLATSQEGPAGKKRLGQIADLMQAMAEQERAGYVPLMRFGDYYIAVKPKVGTEAGSLGGYPRVAWFQRVESKSPWESIFGRPAALGEKGTPRAATEAIAQLRNRFPPDKFDIEHGYLSRNPDAMRTLNVPAIEKLMWALEHRSATGEKSFARNEGYQALMDEIRSQLYDELKAGFKKRATNVPGYSPDFRRNIGSYSYWLAEHNADLTHGDEIERTRNEIDKHPDRNVRDFWRNWDQDQARGTGVLDKAANAMGNFAFYWAMGGVPAISAHIMTHGPIVGLSSLASGIDAGRAAAAMTRAGKDILARARFDTENGLNYGDIAKLAKTPAERAFLTQLENEGAFHSNLADEMGRASQVPRGATGAAKATWRRMLDIVGSTVSAADRFNRLSIALATHRLMQDPKLLQAAADKWGGDENFKDSTKRYGTTPEGVARFALSDSAFDYGVRNLPEFARGPVGKLFMQFHNFVYRAMGKQMQLLTRRGADGRKALALMMLGVGALAGTQGLPFMQDVENAYDWIHKELGGRNTHVADEMRRWLEDKAGFGQFGADMVMRGPISTILGVDLTNRLGFGDVISRNFETGAPLPAAASILYRALADAITRARSHQGALAVLSETLPNMLKYPTQALGVWPQQGVRSLSGKTNVLPAGSVTPADRARRALGWQPLDVTRRYEQIDRAYRASHPNAQ